MSATLVIVTVEFSTAEAFARKVEEAIGTVLRISYNMFDVANQLIRYKRAKSLCRLIYDYRFLNYDCINLVLIYAP